MWRVDMAIILEKKSTCANKSVKLQRVQVLKRDHVALQNVGYDLRYSDMFKI